MDISEGVRSTGEYAVWKGKEYEVGKASGEAVTLQAFAQEPPAGDWREMPRDVDRGRRFLLDVPVAELESWVAVTATARWQDLQLGIKGVDRDGNAYGYLDISEVEPYEQMARAQGVRLTVQGPSWTEAEIPLSALKDVKESKVIDLLDRRRKKSSGEAGR